MGGTKRRLSGRNSYAGHTFASSSASSCSTISSNATTTTSLQHSLSSSNKHGGSTTDMIHIHNGSGSLSNTGSFCGSKLTELVCRSIKEEDEKDSGACLAQPSPSMSSASNLLFKHSRSSSMMTTSSNAHNAVNQHGRSHDDNHSFSHSPPGVTSSMTAASSFSHQPADSFTRHASTLGTSHSSAASFVHRTKSTPDLSNSADRLHRSLDYGDDSKSLILHLCKFLT